MCGLGDGEGQRRQGWNGKRPDSTPNHPSGRSGRAVSPALQAHGQQWQGMSKPLVGLQVSNVSRLCRVNRGDWPYNTLAALGSRSQSLRGSTAMAPRGTTGFGLISMSALPCLGTDPNADQWVVKSPLTESQHPIMRLNIPERHMHNVGCIGLAPGLASCNRELGQNGTSTVPRVRP